MAARNFCSSCGSVLGAGSAYCGTCGVRVPSSVPVSTTEDIPHTRVSIEERAKGAVGEVPHGNHESQLKPETPTQQSLPVYAGTLFGDLPKSPEGMFGSTTFTDGDQDRVEWHERTTVRVLMLTLLIAVAIVGTMAYRSFRGAADGNISDQPAASKTAPATAIVVPGSLHGMVCDFDCENPAPNAQVKLMDQSNRLVAVTGTDENGKYVFHQVPPGRYVVSVYGGTAYTGMVSYLRPVLVYGGEETKVETIQIGR